MSGTQGQRYRPLATTLRVPGILSIARGRELDAHPRRQAWLMHPIIPSKLYKQAGQIVTSSSGVRVAVFGSDGLIALPFPTVLFTIGAAGPRPLGLAAYGGAPGRTWRRRQGPAKALPAGQRRAPWRQAGGNYRVTNECSRCTLPA